jgi:hypothetical protein
MDLFSPKINNEKGEKMMLCKEVFTILEKN